MHVPHPMTATEYSQRLNSPSDFRQLRATFSLSEAWE
jgi:hypothetical protein